MFFLKISSSGEWSVSTRECITGAKSVLVGRVVDRYRLFTKYLLTIAGTEELRKENQALRKKDVRYKELIEENY